MTRYDYQYQRRVHQGRPPPRRRRFKRVSNRAIYNLLVGIVIGLGSGLFYAWEVEPVIFLDHIPSDLDTQHYHEYLLLIAQTFSVEQDIDVASARLATLAPNNPAGIVAEQTEKMILTGANRADIRAMVELAAALGVTNPAVESYLP